MTTYKWEPFDEDIKSMLEQSVFLNPAPETEEEMERQDVEDHDLPQWVKNLEENQSDKEE
jgi:hypothetical protein